MTVSPVRAACRANASFTTDASGPGVSPRLIAARSRIEK